MQKSLETDENVIKRVFKDYIIWEMKAEDDAVAAVVVERPDEPSTKAGVALGVVISDSPDEKGRPVIACVPSLVKKAKRQSNCRMRRWLSRRGHLFVASHVDFLEKVLGRVEERDRLTNDDDYKRVNEELKKLGATEICIRNFSPRRRTIPHHLRLVQGRQAARIGDGARADYSLGPRGAGRRHDS